MDHQSAKNAFNSYLDTLSDFKKKGEDPDGSCAEEINIFEGARFEQLGYLITPLLKEGQYAEMKARQPEAPTYEQLVDAGVFQGGANRSPAQIS
ncbi:hypothetical protein KBZ08_14090 [Cyanobium sp. Candia 9D4]|nr:hypothetical protein [Cyanobium sp. Candia 9D4]